MRVEELGPSLILGYKYTILKQCNGAFKLMELEEGVKLIIASTELSRVIRAI